MILIFTDRNQVENVGVQLALLEEAALGVTGGSVKTDMIQLTNLTLLNLMLNTVGTNPSACLGACRYLGPHSNCPNSIKDLILESWQVVAIYWMITQEETLINEGILKEKAVSAIPSLVWYSL